MDYLLAGGLGLVLVKNCWCNVPPRWRRPRRDEGMDQGSVKAGSDRAASNARAYRNHPDNSLREPVRDWRDVPSLQEVVLKHFDLDAE